MRIISRKTIKNFWEKPNRSDAKESLESWFFEAKQANWRNSADVKRLYKNASILTGERVVFNIAGNKYRLIIAINYKSQIIYIRFIGTHKEYDKVNVLEI